MTAALAGMATVIVALGLLGLFAAALPRARALVDRDAARLRARAHTAPPPAAEAELAAAIAVALHHERRRAR